MIRRWIGVAVGVLSLSACAEMGQYPSHSYGGPAPMAQPAPQGYSGPSLTHIQEEALADGCQLRYSGIPHKLRQCLHLEGNWQEALAQGCQKRYSGNERKFRACMAY